MQWTPNRVINDEPVCERPTVVSTCCANGEEFRAAAHQHHILTTNLSLNHSSLWNEVDSHTGCEIWHDTAPHTSVLRNEPLQIMRSIEAEWFSVSRRQPIRRGRTRVPRRAAPDAMPAPLELDGRDQLSPGAAGLSSRRQCLKALHAEGGFPDWAHVERVVISFLRCFASRTRGAVRHETHQTGKTRAECRGPPALPRRHPGWQRIVKSGGAGQRSVLSYPSAEKFAPTSRSELQTRKQLMALSAWCRRCERTNCTESSP